MFREYLKSVEGGRFFHLIILPCICLLIVFSFSISAASSGHIESGGSDKMWGDNSVYVDLVSPMSPDTPLDTVFVGVEYAWRVHIENDILLGGLSLGFEMTSQDGATWSWMPQPDGFMPDGSQAVTVIEGSRLGFPDGWALDMTKLLVTEKDLDGVSPDTIMIGGVAMMVGLSTGPLEPMALMHFRVDAMDGEAGTLCIDSCFVPPSGVFYFVDMGGGFPPEFDGPFCWPVVKRMMLGDFDLDGQITVGDPVEMIACIFHGSFHPYPDEVGDVNCDGSFNIGDVIFMIKYIFMHGPAPECP